MAHVCVIIGEMSVLNVTVEQGLVGLTSGSSTALVQDKTMITIDNVKNKGLFIV
jgi:hypothetical protein